jgi:Dyp-type peroxidase family
MPVKLSTPASEVDTSDPGFAQMLHNLQANILKPHGRDFARHIFLRFTAPPEQVKAWIRRFMVPRVTSAQQQLSVPNGVDGGVVGGFFLSAKGYEYLGFPISRFASGAFRKGMKDQRDGLLDGLFDRDNKDPHPGKWEPGFQGEIHALVTLADDSETKVEAEAELTRQAVAGVAAVLTTEEGNTLRRENPKVIKPDGKPRKDPVEHFGYFDGISQPAFIKRDWEKQPHAEWDPGARLSLVLTDDPLTDEADAFGSYLVYRKLGQNIAQFQAAVSRLAATLGVDEDLAGAFVVGRFKDGTPVLRSMTPGIGEENDFAFREDREGSRCPFHAHIRKVNPRGTTPATSLEDERNRRIARRGIPYGRPLPGVATLPEADPDPNLPRGLLFMCFQSDVDRQFEFIQRTWVDNEHFPTGVLTFGILQRDTGDDPLIGQDRDEAQRWPKKWGEGKAGKKTFNFESAVTLEGGEYFFAPSLPFLRAF